MAAEFPLNDLDLGRYGGAAGEKAAKEPWWPGSDDDVDEFFLAAILALEAEERQRLGRWGRWPLWQLRQWAIGNRDAVENLITVGAMVATVTLGVLGYVVAQALLQPWR